MPALWKFDLEGKYCS